MERCILYSKDFMKSNLNAGFIYLFELVLFCVCGKMSFLF